MRPKTFANQPDKCAVCGAPVAGPEPLTDEFQGDVYVFCGPDCLKRFQEDPAAYAGASEEEEAE